MGPTITSRIKTPDARIPLLYTQGEVRVTKHNSSAKEWYVTLMVKLLVINVT